LAVKVKDVVPCTLSVQRLEAADTLPGLFLSAVSTLNFSRILGQKVNVYNLGRMVLAVQINLAISEKQSLR
jgi:hypothetical protein